MVAPQAGLIIVRADICNVAAELPGVWIFNSYARCARMKSNARQAATQPARETIKLKPREARAALLLYGGRQYVRYAGVDSKKMAKNQAKRGEK